MIRSIERRKRKRNEIDFVHQRISQVLKLLFGLSSLNQWRSRDFLLHRHLKRNRSVRMRFSSSANRFKREEVEEKMSYRRRKRWDKTCQCVERKIYLQPTIDHHKQNSILSWKEKGQRKRTNFVFFLCLLSFCLFVFVFDTCSLERDEDADVPRQTSSRQCLCSLFSLFSRLFSSCFSQWILFVMISKSNWRIIVSIWLDKCNVCLLKNNTTKKWHRRRSSFVIFFSSCWLKRVRPLSSRSVSSSSLHLMSRWFT